MVITGEVILELILKWLVPFVCVALAGYIGTRIKKGNKSIRKEEWEAIAKESNVHEQICGKHFEAIQKESKEMDDKILDALKDFKKEFDKVHLDAEENRKELRKDLDVVRKGVLDAHLQNLIATCKVYIQRGYITPSELEAYNERLNTYHALGGNGHMGPWDARIQSLPCHD